jgi:hypothetical protein
MNASIMAANMLKNSLKNVESDINKILYETFLDFLQRNGTYFLNNPPTIQIEMLKCLFEEIVEVTGNATEWSLK